MDDVKPTLDDNTLVLPDGRSVPLATVAEWLAEWRRLGKGPRSVKVGSLRLYPLAELQQFVARAA